MQEVLHTLIDVASGQKAHLSPDEAAALHAAVGPSAESAPVDSADDEAAPGLVQEPAGPLAPEPAAEPVDNPVDNPEQVQEQVQEDGNGDQADG